LFCVPRDHITIRVDDSAMAKEEMARLARAARFAEQARLRENERLRQEQEEDIRRLEAERLLKERQDLINCFCTRYGFSNLKEPRRAGCTIFGASTYALHQAAELGKAKMVAMMLEEGASPLHQNSSKQTAMQSAQKKNKGGSHDAVLQVLRDAIGAEEEQTWFA